MTEETEPRRPLRSRPVARRTGPPFQVRIVVLALAGGLPALLTAYLLLRDAPMADSVHRLIVVVLAGVWIGFAIAVYRATVEPMRSIANLLEALRGGDYAIRGRHARKGDVLGDVVLEANRLGATLRAQRFEALEASALLHKVLAEIDVAVLAFALRLASTLLRRRTRVRLPAFKAGAGDARYSLELPRSWLARNALTAAALETEARQWETIGRQFAVRRMS